MTRRAFVPATFAAAATTSSAADAAKPVYLELAVINSATAPTTSVSGPPNSCVRRPPRSCVPARYRLAPLHPPSRPIRLSWARSYPTAAAIEEIAGKLAHDDEYQRDVAAYNAQPGLNYERMESSLLVAFAGYPKVVPPPNDGKRPARLFEVRNYESSNTSTLRKKVQMFNDGEIGAFERAGGQPVFFGETVIGPNQPSLTYLLSYEDLAGRDKVWKAFGADPAWQKLRTTPGLSDAEIVSNISNYLVTPLPFSQIR